MKTIRERISVDFEGRGIFTEFAIHSEDYEVIFKDTTPTVLDTLFLSLYGNVQCSPLLTNVVDVAQFVDILYAVYIDKWLKVAYALDIDYNIISPYNIIENSEYDRSYERSNDSNSENNSNVYGFNDSSSSIPESTNTSSVERNETTSESNERTKTRAGNIRNTYQSLIASELALRNNKMIDIVMRDVKELGGISVY